MDYSGEIISICGIRAATHILTKLFRDSYNFSPKLAMLAHARASKAQMNMDVNLCRLPELFLYFMKFLETLNNAVTYG